MLQDTDAARAEMLVLAALTYRGFSDFLIGTLHQGAVRRGVSEGLANLLPVAGKWSLVWGPAASRLGAELDSSCVTSCATPRTPIAMSSPCGERTRWC